MLEKRDQTERVTTTDATLRGAEFTLMLPVRSRINQGAEKLQIAFTATKRSRLWRARLEFANGFGYFGRFILYHEKHTHRAEQMRLSSFVEETSTCYL